jgi:putative membrane protein
MSEHQKQSLTHVLGVLAFVALFGGVLLFGRSMTSSAQDRSGSDRQFATNAAAGGMAEVKLGELAQEKAGSEAVKSFGKRMVDDHSKAGEQLKETARGQNIELPSQLTAKDQAAYNRLSKLSGTEFDRAYMQMMVKDHEEDVAEFKREASSGSNPALKDFAAQTLPTLQDHLKNARDVASNRKASM